MLAGTPATSSTPSATVAASPTLPAPTPSPTLSPPTPLPPTSTPAGVSKLPFLVVGNPSQGGALRSPHDGVIDGDGMLIIVDYDTQKLVKFDKDGKFKNFIEPVFPANNPGRPSYLAADSANNLIVVYSNGESYKMDQSGKVSGKFGDTTLGSIYSIGIDKTGNIYTITSGDYLVKYDSAGKVVNKLQANTKTGDKLGEGQFNYNSKIRLDSSGTVYLMEQYDPSRIQKFDAALKYQGLVEVPPQKDGKPSQISELFFDNNGNIMVINYEKLWKL